jgi:hypothetical protein
MSAARSSALEFNGEASPVVVELREDDDGVQTEMTRTMVCRDLSVASYRCKETRPEVSIPMAMVRARRRTVRAEGSWGWHAYHGFQEVKASPVARFAWSRWSDGVAMAHRSFVRRTVRSVEVVFVNLGHGRSSKLVREVRKEEGDLPVQKGEKWEASSHREHRSLPTAVAERRALVQAAWWQIPKWKVGEVGRRGRGFYRRGLGSKQKGNKEV